MSLTVSARVATDAAAGSVVAATLVQWLPPLAALVGIVYYLLLISANPQFLKLLSWLGRFRIRIPLPVKVELVEDWRQGMRWLSIQFIALAAAIQAALVAFPLQSYIPPEYMKAAVVICLIGAFLGRFVKQKGNPNELDQPVQR
jgi:uncharacterized membrane protein YfcA